MNKYVRQILALLMALMFMVYYGRIVLLTHFHFINGVLVVQSHVDYNGDNNDLFAHHSGSDMVHFAQMIHILTFEDALQPFFIRIVPPHFIDILTSNGILGLVPSCIAKVDTLRAPPSCLAA